MSRELLASQKNNSGILLDPRTKLAVLITIAVFVLGGSYEGIMQYYIIVLAAIPLLLLSAARKWKDAVLYILIFGGSLCLEMFGLSRLTGVANYIAVAVVGILLRFTPSVVMGYFVVTTTTVSEFVAAMERLHLPQQITIPMSVMFRFFPTVAEEWSAIGDAMRMRGVRFGGGKAAARVAAFALIAIFRADDEQIAAQIGAQGDGFILSVRQGGHGFDGVVEQVAVERA